MSLVRSLYARFRHRLHELGKFGAVGLLGFVVTEIGFNLLHFDVGLGLLTSNVIATGVAAIVTFVGNKYWTFARRGNHSTRKETVIFFALNGAGALIQYACTWIAKNGFGVSDKVMLNVAFFIGIVLATVFRYWSYRTWVWAARPPADPGPATPPEALAEAERRRSHVA